MSEKHWIVSELHSRVEFETSDLGLAAFRGEIQTIKSALAKGIDWDIENQYLLEAAVHGNQMEIVRLLLDSDMPMKDSHYSTLYYWCPDPSLKEKLPPRPDVTIPITEEDFEGVKKNLVKSKINDVDASLGDRVGRKPIHLAARKCNLEIIKFLVREGADVHALDGEEKSVLRIIAECPTVENDERRDCYRYMENLGVKLEPPVEGWLKRWSLRRGSWLS